MQIPPTPISESSRIATLRLLNILDTEPEERFDRLTRMARRIFSVPIALICLVDSNRQWFKSCMGLEIRETSRNSSFCAHAILGEGVFLIPDTLLDERFADNPLVIADPHIRFYAGYPLKIGAENLGTMCIIDDKPRLFGPEEQQILKDVAEMAEQEIAALQLAITDDLTSLSNRRGFEALAQHTLNICRRMGKPATLLYFDLDRFKRINDTHGHAEGDCALRVFARSLLAVLRNSDVIGRLGGDEFGVLLTGAHSASAKIVVSRVKAWIAAEEAAGGRDYEIQFSVGQIEYDNAVHHSIADMLSVADAAMYENKRATSVGAPRRV
jgi:diguanylate cyclase (GGDEF)-like protein